MNDDTDLQDQIRQMENPMLNNKEPMISGSIIPDGRMNPNLAKLGHNTFSQGFGHAGANPAYHPNGFSKTQGYFKPPMDGPMPLPPHPAFKSSQDSQSIQGPAQQAYDIHANSKHYFPANAEFLNNDYINKPGASFNQNKHAVIMNERKVESSNVDPNLAQLRNQLNGLMGNAGQNQAINPQQNHQAFGNPGFAGYNPRNSQPVSGHHGLLFAPQIGNNRYEKDENLQRNIEMLGGLQSTLQPMESSLMENEIKFMGRNSLNTMQNHTLNSSNPQFNPYSTQNVQGYFSGEGLGHDQFGQGQNLAGNIGRMRYNQNDPYHKPPASKIELSRMMRIEREDKIMKQHKMQQKFDNFNKMLREGQPNPYAEDSQY